MIEYKLTIGLNDKESKIQKVATLEAYKIITNITKEYFQAFTIYECNGVYTHQNGAVTIEKSLAVDILVDEQQDKKITKIIELVKIALNQECIMLHKSVQNVSFV